MGIYEKPSKQFLSALGKEFNYELPAEHGFDAVHAMHDRRAKLFFAMGGNFLSAAPDTSCTAQALRNTRLTVHVSTKLNRSHLVHGKQALILPCLRRTERPGGFYLPNAVRDAREFRTSTQRANFTVNPIPKVALKPDELILMAIRSHDQFNTTIYGLSDRYRGVRNGRRVVFMNASDVEQRGLKASQWVDLISHHQGETRRAERFMIVPYEIPPGSAAAYFPETNVLLPARSVGARRQQHADIQKRCDHGARLRGRSE